MGHRLLPALLLLTFVGVAQGQTEDDLDLAQSTGPTAIGIDNCAAEIEENIRFAGTLTGDFTVDYDLRLTWSTADTPCERSVFDGLCPATGATDVEPCGCLKQVTTSSLILDTDVAALDIVGICTGSSRSIRFFLEYHTDDDGSEQAKDVVSMPVVLDVDLERPVAPGLPPTIVGGERSLVVSRAEDPGSDVDHFEVCIRPNTGVEDEAVDDGAITDNDTLREGFAESDCSTTSSLSSYRVEGLSNGISYLVVYASVDAAGNRGPNSPPAVGSPVDVDDFAEFYSRRGGRETGGCQGTPGQEHSPLILVFFALLALAPRLRRKA